MTKDTNGVKCLDVYYCYQPGVYSDSDIISLLKFEPNFDEIDFKYCSTDAILAEIANNNPNLQMLALHGSNEQITHTGLETLFEKCDKLATLVIRFASDVATIAYKTALCDCRSRNISALYFEHCDFVTVELLECIILANPNLKVVEVESCEAVDYTAVEAIFKRRSDQMLHSKFS